jgi:hypothetical protein
MDTSSIFGQSRKFFAHNATSRRKTSDYASSENGRVAQPSTSPERARVNFRVPACRRQAASLRFSKGADLEPALGNVFR